MDFTFALALSLPIAIGFAAIGSGIGSGIPAGQACLGMVRQPTLSGRILVTLLIGSAVCQTPAILAMIVALMLMFVKFSNIRSTVFLSQMHWYFELQGNFKVIIQNEQSIKLLS